MKAHELLQRPGSWTQGKYCLTPDGEHINPENGNENCRFCISGAIQYVYSEKGAVIARIKANNACKERFGYGIISFNDTPGRKHEEIVAFLKELDI